MSSFHDWPSRGHYTGVSIAITQKRAVRYDEYAFPGGVADYEKNYKNDPGSVPGEFSGGQGRKVAVEIHDKWMHARPYQRDAVFHYIKHVLPIAQNAVKTATGRAGEWTLSTADCMYQTKEGNPFVIRCTDQGNPLKPRSLKFRRDDGVEYDLAIHHGRDSLTLLRTDLSV